MDTRILERMTTALPRRISRRTAWAAVTGTALGLGSATTSAHQATPATGNQDLKVVLHVSDPDGWPPALSNLHNLTTQFPAIEVRVVVDGGGVYVFQGENDLTRELVQAAAAGVVIQACHNALAEKQIDPATLPPFVAVVPGGVPALIEAQNAGYRYVKP